MLSTTWSCHAASLRDYNDITVSNAGMNDSMTVAAVNYLVGCLLSLGPYYIYTIEKGGVITVSPIHDSNFKENCVGIYNRAIRCITHANSGTIIGFLTDMSYADNGDNPVERVTYGSVSEILSYHLSHAVFEDGSDARVHARSPCQ